MIGYKFQAGDKIKYLDTQKSGLPGNRMTPKMLRGFARTIAFELWNVKPEEIKITEVKNFLK